MANIGITTTDIADMITAKRALIVTINERLADVLADPKPTYSIDGQTVSWDSYRNSLMDSQGKEIDSIMKLLDMMNTVAPYQFASTLGNGCGGCC